MIGYVEARQETRHIKIAAVCVLAVVMGIVAISINIVMTMRNAANTIDANRAVDAVSSTISYNQKSMGVTLRDNAIWDVAYAVVQSEGAGAWIKNNWGIASKDYPLYDGVIVLDPDGEQIGGHLKGQQFNAMSVFGPALLQQSQAASLGPSTRALVTFLDLSGQIAMVATMAIQPYESSAANRKLYTLTFFKYITDEYLAAIAEDSQVAGLKLSAQLDPSLLNYAIRDTSGTPLAYISWPRLNPGSAVFDLVFPQVLAVVALFAIFLFLAMFFRTAELGRQQARTAEAIFHATHDHLTKLLNRTGLIERLASAPAGSVIHLVDLDGFKSVNDAWGHAVGDALICMVADRLRNVSPGGLAIARIGGDEFAMVHASDVDPVLLGAGLVSVLKEPFIVHGRSIEVGASVGFARLTTDQEPLELVRRADIAMYHAKENGRGQVMPYNAKLDRYRENLADAEKRLKKAIEQDEIRVVFQPLAASVDGRITVVEALARWSPTTGPVSPDVFIPLAERAGLIDPLSMKVLEYSIRAVKEWPELHLSVNVSPLHLCKLNFADEIKQMLDREEFDPSRLIFEVTEGVFISKPKRASRSINALHAIGVRFAMDDFGTGHASIGTLRQYGFDKIKIDRSLIAGGHEAIIKATIQLAAALNISVIAEGVETQEQAAFAIEAGCELLQGYLIGKPMPIDELKERLEAA